MATPALELGWPGQVCFDSADNLYLVDSEDSQIVYLDPWQPWFWAVGCCWPSCWPSFSAWPHWRNGGMSWDIMGISFEHNEYNGNIITWDETHCLSLLLRFERTSHTSPHVKLLCAKVWVLAVNLACKAVNACMWLLWCRVENIWKPWTLCSIYATNSRHILPCNLGRWEWVRAQFSTSNWRKDHRSWLPLWGFLGGRNQICWWWSLTARCDEESDGKWGWWSQIMATLWWSNIGHFYGHLNMTIIEFFSVAMFDFQRVNQNGWRVSELRFSVTLCDHFLPKRTQPKKTRVKQK